MPNLPVNGSFKNNSPFPDFHWSCKANSDQPWDNVAQAHAGITSAYRSGGKLIYILIGGQAVPHMYQGGTDEDDLKPIGGIAVPSLPTMTLAYFRSTFNGNSSIIYIDNGGKSGAFQLDPDAVGAVDDNGALTIIKNGDVFKRMHNEKFDPEWWDVKGDGVTNDFVNFNLAFAAAAAYKTATDITVEMKVKKKYLVNVNNSYLNVMCNLTGFGSFITRNLCGLKIAAPNLTCRDFTIDGGAANGFGLYNTGYEGVTVDNIRVSGVVSQGISFVSAHKTVIKNCRIKNSTGNFGDGIYLARCNDFVIDGNIVTGVKRIGITTEGTDTDGGAYCNNGLIINNIVHDLTYTADNSNFPNGGIWCENTTNVTVENNRVENTYARGICITSSIPGARIRGKNKVIGNSIKNCVTASGLIGTGIAVVYGYDQKFLVADNTVTDCKRPMEFGDMDELVVENNTFDVIEQTPDWSDTIFRILPLSSLDETKSTLIVFRKNINAINNPNLVAGYMTVNANCRAEVIFEDNIGNWAFGGNTNNSLIGNITVKNTLMDFSMQTAANQYAYRITGTYTLDHATMKISTAQRMLFYSLNLEIVNNSKIWADSSIGMTLFIGGSIYHRYENSTFENVYWYDMRRAGTEFRMKNCSFDGYSSQGFVYNTVTLCERLEVDGCRFSETLPNIPLSFANGVTLCIVGENTYATTKLVNGVIPHQQTNKIHFGTTAERPISPSFMYQYLNTELGAYEYWNNSEWITDVKHITNNSTTVSTGTSLNTLYGGHPAGFSVYFPNRTGGPKIYEKVSPGNTSKWNDIPINFLAET